mmetsp:Transcript_56882/g.65176  ORF Transcript_56882/g.65176 Transcript_56882/m.65176 type:complete len:105 (-) Transcript_56882:30-344(-)
MALKNDFVRQRNSNAKEVHRVWRESALDPFRGRRPPKIREPVIHNISAAPLAGASPKRQGGAAATAAAVASLLRGNAALDSPAPLTGFGSSDSATPNTNAPFGS